MEGVLAIVGGVIISIIIVGVIILLAGAAENFTAIAENLGELCTKISDWWNGICVWFIEAG